jgi:hypothetical protein
MEQGSRGMGRDDACPTVFFLIFAGNLPYPLDTFYDF